MSDKITRLDDHRPHLAGAARCLFCKHKWAFVAPVGTEIGALECPKCHSRSTIARVE